jgi:hypothetical protein
MKNTERNPSSTARTRRIIPPANSGSTQEISRGVAVVSTKIAALVVLILILILVLVRLLLILLLKN